MTHRATFLAKRVFDVVVASVVLFALAPLLFLLVVIIRLDTAGPVFFRQERVGTGKSTFTMVKLRTMHDGSSDAAHRSFVRSNLGEPATGGPQKLGRQDARITRVGAVLRKFSLDELPQLANVIRGDMSLVGPRPCLPWEIELFEPISPNRWDVLPGMTGLWQVSGRSDLSVEEMLQLDSHYVQTWSFWRDVHILLNTTKVMHTGS